MLQRKKMMFLASSQNSSLGQMAGESLPPTVPPVGTSGRRSGPAWPF